MNSFAGVHPGNNQLISGNLLTTQGAQSGAELADHDRAALEILDAWTSAPAYAPMKISLATLTTRLKRFVSNPDEKLR